MTSDLPLSSADLSERHEQISDKHVARPGFPSPGLRVLPRLVPSQGHSALIPDTSVPSGLRASLAMWVAECVGGGLAVPFNVPRRSRRQGLRTLPCG